MKRPRCDHAAHMLLDFYVNGTLDGAEHATVDAHLETCAVCGEVVSELTEVARELSDLNESVLDAASRRRPLWLRGPAFAAAAVLAIFAVLGVYSVLRVDRSPVVQTLDLGVGSMRDAGLLPALSLAPDCEFVDLTFELPISAGAGYTLRLKGPPEADLFGPVRVQNWDSFGRISRRLPVTLFERPGEYRLEIEETDAGGSQTTFNYAFSVGPARHSNGHPPSAGGEIARIHDLIDEGEVETAETEAQVLLERVEKREGPDSLGVAEVLDVVVVIADRLGKHNHPDARSLARRAVDLKEALLGPESLELAKSIDNFGRLLRRQGDYEGSIAAYRRSLEIREAVLSPEDPALSFSLNGLAVAHGLSGEYGEALRLTERSLEIREKAFGADHPEVASTLNNLGMVARNVGDFVRAGQAFERSLKIYEQGGKESLPKVAMLLSNLANLRADLDDLVGGLPDRAPRWTRPHPQHRFQP